MGPAQSSVQEKAADTEAEPGVLEQQAGADTAGGDDKEQQATVIDAKTDMPSLRNFINVK